MNKYFVGYVTLPTISSVTDTQARKLTHLNLAFAPMKDGETFMALNERQLLEIARLRGQIPDLPFWFLPEAAVTGAMAKPLPLRKGWTS